MKEILVDESRRIQLSILKDIDSFCTQEGLTYYMSYGTLLGAVRHCGFIPWDDDIDIAMPYPDYIKFCKEYGRNNYRVHHWVRTPKFHCNYAKVEDIRTLLKEKIVVNYEMGINIDVAPIIGLPENRVKALRYFRKIAFFRNSLQLKKMRFRRGRKAYKQFMVGIARLLLVPFSYKMINKHLDKLYSKYDYTNSKYVICVGSFNTQKEIFERERLGAEIRLPFENYYFCAPEGYDLWLKQIFGDYMQLPPEEKRITHHDFKMFWK